jgi:hypothetical protein
VELLLAAVAIVLTIVVLAGSMDVRPRPPGPPDGRPPAAVPAPATAGAEPAAADNPVPDPGFEAGLGAWRPVGGTALERTGPGRGGGWAAGFRASGTADQGMALPEVLRCTPGRTYAAAVWVLADRPQTLLQVNLLEVLDGRRFAVDTVGAVLADRRWQRVEVAHLAHRRGAALSLEIVLPKGSPGALVLVDDLEVVTHQASFMTGG